MSRTHYAAFSLMFLAACTGATPVEVSDFPTTPAASPTPAASASAETPPGSASGEAGGGLLEKTMMLTYDVTERQADGLDARCADQVYDDCASAPVALRWQDTDSRQPKSVTIELQTSVFCASGDDHVQNVGLNGADHVIGSYEGALEDCVCPAPPKPHVIEVDGEKLALAGYRPGAANAITVGGSARCVGFAPNASWGGAIARITIHY